MINILERTAKLFETDIETLKTSIFSGTSSTGIGMIITNLSNWDWQFSFNLVSLFWGAISSIVLTLLSLLVADVYKCIKKKLTKNKES